MNGPSRRSFPKWYTFIALKSENNGGVVMKVDKVLKRLVKIEESMSDVLERYSGSAPHIRAALQDAKAAVIRAKDAVSLQASSGTTSAPKKAATKEAASEVPPSKATKKQKSPVN
jgi:hypothetical protein